ncbi:MAG TPA: pilus assembly protein PilM [Phycisphaerales bacterium]|nr:pilus assembly protein PilM [Phycisphaerales bacterium]
MGLLNFKRVGNVGLPRHQSAPVAVDFGASSLKVLQITEEETPELIAAGCVPTPENLLANVKRRLDFQFEALPGLIGSLPLKGRRAICAIPSALTFCKHAQLPRQEGMPIDVLADAMLTEQLGRDASTLVRRVIEVPDTDRSAAGKGEYICLATGREIVDALMKSLKAAKLEVVGMHSEFEAALRAFAHLNRREDDKQKATLYLDIGCGHTSVTIAHGPTLVFARTIATGGHALDECLAKELACTVEEARASRLAMAELVGVAPARAPAVAAAASGHGPGGGTMVAEDRRAERPAPGLSPDLSAIPRQPAAPRGASLREPLEILTDEIGMCVRYHDSIFRGTRVAGIVFVGGEARHRGLCQHVARTLRMPAQVADPLARVARPSGAKAVGLELSEPQPGWAVAVGLCQSPTDL